jgi:alkylhydroperoxidase/carboxymuconolactone decarboxylase family protein YurZ
LVSTPAEGGLLDERTRALVLIAAAVCADSPTHTFTSLVTAARKAGVSDEEILGVLLSVAPSAGESRVVAVTPRISKALGYDVLQAMEYG